MAAVARLRNALENGKWANAADRELIKRLDELCPNSAELVHKVREFHRGAARTAVLKGAAGVVYAGSGYPASPMPHLTRTGRPMPGQHVFAYPHEAVTFVNLGKLAHKRVAAVTAPASDPARLLDMPAVRDIKGRLQVQCQLVAQYWSPEDAPRIVGGYADLLPPGSTLVLTLGAPVTAEGHRFADAIAAAIGMPVYAHTTGDVRDWLDRAGLAEPEVDVIRSKDPRCGGVMITATAVVPLADRPQARRAALLKLGPLPFPADPLAFRQQRRDLRHGEFRAVQCEGDLAQLLDGNRDVHGVPAGFHGCDSGRAGFDRLVIEGGVGGKDFGGCAGSGGHGSPVGAGVWGNGARAIRRTHAVISRNARLVRRRVHLTGLPGYAPSR